jgi:hypothetical protein
LFDFVLLFFWGPMLLVLICFVLPILLSCVFVRRTRGVLPGFVSLRQCARISRIGLFGSDHARLTEDRQRPVAVTVKAKASADGRLTWPGRCAPIVSICVVWLCVGQMLAVARVDVLVLLRKLRPRGGVFVHTPVWILVAIHLVFGGCLISRPVSGPMCFNDVPFVFNPGGCPQLMHSPFHLYFRFGAPVMASVTSGDRC